MIEIDNRDRQDLLDEIQELAASYTPEWRFDTVQPDAASVIGLIFSHQMMENVRKLNQVWNKYHIEFANMYGLSRKSAIPAKTVCTLKVSESVQGGVGLPKGTQVIGLTDAGDEIVFTFSQDLYAVNTELTDIIEMQDSYSMFPWQRKNPILRRQAVVMCFKKFPNVQEQSASLCSLCIHGNLADAQMAELFADKEYFALSVVQDGRRTKPVEMVQCCGDRITLGSSETLPVISVDDEEMTVLVLEMRKPPAHRIDCRNLAINSIELFTPRQSVRPDYIWNGREEVTQDRFLPFTEQPALYDECLIGQDFLFDWRGAVITLRFRLEFGSYRSNSTVSALPDLPIVRRKTQKSGEDRHYECRVDEVSFSYFNGKGWRRLPTGMEVTAIFSGEENAGEYQIDFVVPGDWESVVQGGYEGKCIRMQIVRADNCYLQDVEYRYPVLSDVMLCMEEQAKGIVPDSVAVVRGTSVEKVQDRLKNGSGFCAFEQALSQGNMVYWGFNRPFGQGPVSLFVDLEKQAPPPGLNLAFSYSNGKGFRPLKVVDHTNGFLNSGILQFAPPSDIAESEVDGIKRYWIRLQIQNQNQIQRGAPVVRKVLMNAVTAENIITRDEQDYYIDTVTPNMRFPLYAENIFSVQVWVNEKEQLTEDERNRLMKDMPAGVRAEYNFLGEVEDFYVLWHEVDGFEHAADMERCYCVDRGRNELIFGNGVHVRIPQSTGSIAFKTRVLCCDGEKANIRAGSIDRFRNTVISVEQVVNPIDAYGGTNLERIQNTLKRGSNILASRRRMVTEEDYIREVYAFSDVVAQTACVTGADGAVRLVLLMRDYQKGDFSFRRIQEPLKKHLLDCSETTCGSAFIQVCPPVFVKISIEIWLDVRELSRSIEIRQSWLNRITTFLEPVGEQDEIRWRIGRLPRTSQIMLMLNALESTARIVHMNMLAQYSCEQGICEKALDEIVVSPYMVCCNGTHKINIVGETYAQ